MNVYEKLNKARLMFQSKGVKKSGKNAYAGYVYFELEDILPVANAICEELKATCVVTFGDELAQLSFVDAEKPEDRIVFCSPMSTAKLKGCHEVQNLGAVESYVKRYLYQNCFEIAESDGMDKTHNPYESEGDGNKTKTGKPATPSEIWKSKAPPAMWTKAQLDELKAMLDKQLEDGIPVFNDSDKDEFRKMYANGVKYEDVKRLVLEKQAKVAAAVYGEQPEAVNPADNMDIF